MRETKLSPIGRRAEHQSLEGGQAEQRLEDCSTNHISSSSSAPQTRQPLAILRAVVRYVDCPIDISHKSEVTICNTGTSFGDEGRAELVLKKTCHQDLAEQQSSGQYQQPTDARDQAEQMAGDVLETVLDEVLAFVEMSGTVQTNNIMSEDKLLSMVVPPPDRTKEMKAIENEIRRIEMEIEKFLPKVSTVPRSYEIKKSSRKTRPKKSEKARRGIEPLGQNGVTWRSKQDMKRMFDNKSLFRKAVRNKQ